MPPTPFSLGAVVGHIKGRMGSAWQETGRKLACASRVACFSLLLLVMVLTTAACYEADLRRFAIGSRQPIVIRVILSSSSPVQDHHSSSGIDGDGGTERNSSAGHDHFLFGPDSLQNASTSISPSPGQDHGPDVAEAASPNNTASSAQPPPATTAAVEDIVFALQPAQTNASAAPPTTTTTPNIPLAQGGEVEGQTERVQTGDEGARTNTSAVGALEAVPANTTTTTYNNNNTSSTHGEGEGEQAAGVNGEEGLRTNTSAVPDGPQVCSTTIMISG